MHRPWILLGASFGLLAPATALSQPAREEPAEKGAAPQAPAKPTPKATAQPKPAAPTDDQPAKGGTGKPSAPKATPPAAQADILHRGQELVAGVAEDQAVDIVLQP